MEAESIGLSTLALIVGAVICVWVVTAVMLAFAARHHRATFRSHCPLLRRDVEVEGDEWDGRVMDVRRCSAIHPSTNFDLCGKRCLDLDDFAGALGGQASARAAHEGEMTSSSSPGRSG